MPRIRRVHPPAILAADAAATAVSLADFVGVADQPADDSPHHAHPSVSVVTRSSTVSTAGTSARDQNTNRYASPLGPPTTEIPRNFCFFKNKCMARFDPETSNQIVFRLVARARSMTF